MIANFFWRHSHMKKLLIEAKRAPLPKLFKIIMIVLFLSSGFLFFCAIMGFFSELNDGAGLGSVGDGTVIIGNSDGGSIIHSSGISLGTICFFMALILLAIALTFFLLNQFHKNDKILVYEDGIEFVSQKEVLKFAFSEIESCTLVKDTTIHIKIIGIGKVYCLLWMANAIQAVSTINQQKKKHS